MNAFNVVVWDLASMRELQHLAPTPENGNSTIRFAKETWRDDFRFAVESGFEGVRKALIIELEDLRRWQLLGFTSALVGLILLGLGLVLALVGFKVGGSVSVVLGVLVEVLPIVVFRRVESARRSMRTLLPQYRNLFGMLGVIDYEEDAGVLRERIESVPKEAHNDR